MYEYSELRTTKVHIVLPLLFSFVAYAVIFAIPDASAQWILPWEIKTSPQFEKVKVETNPALGEPSKFGYSLAKGDINNDGYDDLVVGAPEPNILSDDGNGSVWIYLGRPSGLNYNHNFLLDSPYNSFVFGHAIAIGDINNDGYDDIAVGASTADSPSDVPEDKVFVYFGGKSFDTTPDVTFLDPGPSYGQFGSAIAIGDVNNDDFDDVIVGSPLTSFGEVVHPIGDVYLPDPLDGRFEAGKVVVFQGGNTPDPLDFKILTDRFGDVHPYSISPGPRLGSSLALTDFNGDGIDDIVVGVPLEDHDEIPSAGIEHKYNSGKVVIFRGIDTFFRDSDPPMNSPAYHLGDIFLYDNTQFGWAVSGGDVNGDGIGDVIVGAPFATDGDVLEAGKVYAFLGNTAPTDTSVDYFIYDPSPTLGARFGSSISTGLIDNDSIDDLIIGSLYGNDVFADGSGNVRLIWDIDDPWKNYNLLSDPYPHRHGQYGSSSVVLDMNSDGIRDIAIGGPGKAGPERNAGEIFYFQGLGEGCLIATAAYGSPMAKEVQMLREIRDLQLMKTESGSAFMGTFNTLYYSFAPTIAQWENENAVFKEIVRTAITPLITSLSLLQYVEMDSEAKVLGYGILMILLNVGMYFAVPVVAVYKIKKIF